MVLEAAAGNSQSHCYLVVFRPGRDSLCVLSRYARTNDSRDKFIIYISGRFINYKMTSSDFKEEKNYQYKYR